MLRCDLNDVAVVNCCGAVASVVAVSICNCYFGILLYDNLTLNMMFQLVGRVQIDILQNPT